MAMRSVLTIAGSDSSAGAGVQADLKTFAALGVYGTSVVTALTAQDTSDVTAVHEAPPEFIAAQIDAVVQDIRPEAVKTGMLASAAIIEVVAEKLRQYALPNVVVDPVMLSKGGARLLREDAIEALVQLMLPLADVVTPNIPEAEELVGYKIRTYLQIHEAARDIHAMGPRNVVIKGGHREGETVVDTLFDGREIHEFSGPRIHTTSTHGTGCTFASAIAANLALGTTLPEAVAAAREYLEGALINAYPVGHGHGPVNHFWRWEDAREKDGEG
jgi:hydroxymethylpyrimidine/phosphomethylpyrimidine kinase